MMVFVRIVTGIREHLDLRIAEWGLGFFIINYGLGLIGPENGWLNLAAWARMLRYLPENAWGWICILLGIARLVALAVNGTFANTIYSRYSPVVRGLVSAASAVFWFLILLSVSAVPSIGSRTYLLPLVLELWCVSRTWRDIGREARAARAKGGMA